MFIFIQLRVQCLDVCYNLSNLIFQALNGNPVGIKIMSMSERIEGSGWQTAVCTFVSTPHVCAHVYMCICSVSWFLPQKNTQVL
jgi:putative effector of murein hydrolase LrgA (UPF0299 family)